RLNSGRTGKPSGAVMLPGFSALPVRFVYRFRYCGDSVRKRSTFTATVTHSDQPCNIALADDADYSLGLVYNWHSPYAMPFKLSKASFDGVVDAAGEAFAGHKVPNRCDPRIDSPRDNSNGDVAIRYHPQQPSIAVCHWKRAAITASHEPRSHFDRIAWVHRC